MALALTNSTSIPPPMYKAVLIGDGGVGKTTTVNRYRTGIYDRRYIATIGVEVHPLKFYTNRGPVIVNLWDCAGQEKFGGLRDGYYTDAKAAILMCDNTSAPTFRNLGNWLRNFRRVCPNSPVLTAVNKADCTSKLHDYDLTGAHLISAKSYDGMDGLMTELLRVLVGDPTLEILEDSALAPASFN
jgi:GTP-binding nuclear protein Ran